MKNLPLARGLVPLALLSIFNASMPAFANDDLSISVSTDYVTEYVFRGVSLAGEAFQPGVEISYGSFTAGAWASIASGEESVLFDDEIDLYFGYGFELSEKVSASVGATLYHYPQYGGLLDIGTDPGDASTLEVYGGLEFDTHLAPSVTAYYDLTLEAFTLEGGVEHSILVTEKSSVDLGATAGFVSVEGPGDYQYGGLSAAFSYSFTDSTSAYVGANVGLSSQDTFSDVRFDITDLTSIEAPDNSSAWFGIGISSGFLKESNTLSAQTPRSPGIVWGFFALALTPEFQ